ncbi:NADP-dependent oxidoreductase [Occallatibacter riparius]|uniref:NADP-dependent oxidoreductase n=1 Tax=Occallatibacter riparius TaxID=1002689 RepID=A0A9J7BHJ5_9BACT|nr:NADP-dependent oxidoreductase [Occallatibacter riparius]UWZ81899.1 NADP-dependent oxidoreductase [Occallatibacter riparius]
MKAVLLYEYGGPEQLRFEDTDVPDFGENEVLVRVRATSINPVDWKIRSGAAKARMPVDFPAILGRDLAGEVVASGRNVTGFPKGMRVMALANGTYAECTVAKADVLAPIPDSLSFEEAAALPLVTTTGAQLIERAVKAAPGETVLVTGALGGVGRTAVHVARKHRLRVLAGVRASERDQAAALGSDGAVAIDDENEIEGLMDLDAIADTVGGPTIRRLLRAIRSGGVLGSVLGKPENADKFDIRFQAFMAAPDASRLYQLAEDVARKEFSIPIARTMPLSHIQEAHQLAEKCGVGGKIILVP